MRFTDEFPPRAVYLGDVSAADHLAGDTEGRSHRLNALEEMLLVHVTNQNPALARYEDLFSDQPLRSETPYVQALSSLTRFLGRQPAFGPSAQGAETLVDLLLAPAKASPYSLEGQLQFILDKWGFLLGEGFVTRLLRSMDFIREEVIRHQGPSQFKPEAQAPMYGAVDYNEYERYSPDKDWMPRLVLIAKNSYVWLEQLSRKYGRWIRTLDQIPDEELDMLRGARLHRPVADRSVGAQPRQPAHQTAHGQRRTRSLRRIRCIRYDIAEDLGGWDALENLRSRAWQRGIRLSADMVPNHMGIDSTWVIEHPDWFLSLPLSAVSLLLLQLARISRTTRAWASISKIITTIKTDAAVVFKRRRPQIGRDALHLSRQRRHILPVERHRPTGLLQGRRCAKRSSRPSCTWRATSPSSASTRR